MQQAILFVIEIGIYQTFNNTGCKYKRDYEKEKVRNISLKQNPLLRFEMREARKFRNDLDDGALRVY